MTAERIIGLVVLCIAIAIYSLTPFFSGFLTCVALLIASGAEWDDEDDEPPGPRGPEPRRT